MSLAAIHPKVMLSDQCKAGTCHISPQLLMAVRPGAGSLISVSLSLFLYKMEKVKNTLRIVLIMKRAMYST